jgi:membrane protease subunit (stomatin/prohibitin family)
MNCPQCNTPNDPEYKFCLNCGEPLSGESKVKSADEEIRIPPIKDLLSATPRSIARSIPELLQVLTIRMFVILVGLWLLKVILNSLPFIRDMQAIQISAKRLPITTITDTIVYLIIIALLVSYSRTLSVLWPQALPRYKEAVKFLELLIYLVILIVLYNAAQPLILTVASNPRQTLSNFQHLLFIVSLILLVYAIVILYQRLPYWLPSIRQWLTYSFPKGNEVACLNCGNLNSANAAFCIHCGHQIRKENA